MGLVIKGYVLGTENQDEDKIIGILTSDNGQGIKYWFYYIS